MARSLGVPAGYFFLGFESGKAEDNDLETSAFAQLMDSPDGYKFAGALEGADRGQSIEVNYRVAG